MVESPSNSEQSPLFPQSVCVLIPALDESENIRPTVEAVSRALRETCDDFEILIVNDGSTDATGEVADRIAAEMPHVRVFHNERNRGMGHAYVLGYENTRCDYFVYIPGDNTWPHESCRRLLSQLGRADIVTSYPLNPEIRPLGRRMLSSFYTHCLNAIFRRKMHYYNGLNIYPVSFLRKKIVTTTGFGFQAEVLLRALAAGLSCVQVPLPISERAAGGSKAIRIGNIVGVVATILRLTWDLRVRRRAQAQSLQGGSPPLSGSASG
jgi:dolichol-phosphate mannosyltransferase